MSYIINVNVGLFEMIQCSYSLNFEYVDLILQFGYYMHMFYWNLSTFDNVKVFVN